MPSPARTSLVRSIDEALEPIGDGAVIGVGGTVIADHPMTLVRGLIRKDVKDLVLVEPVAGLDADLLIAAGCVRRIHTAYVGAEGLAPIGPSFRAAAEAGTLEVRDLCEGMCAAGLRAAAQRLPFQPWRGGVGTSLPDLNPDLVEFDDPINGEPLLAVPALNLDFALIHAHRSDAYGNVQFRGTRFMDELIAGAAKEVLVEVHELVENATIRERPGDTRFWARTKVIEAPWGTHPYATQGLAPDLDELREYVEVATAAAKGDRAGLERLLEKITGGPSDQRSYLDQLGEDRIRTLERP